MRRARARGEDLDGQDVPGRGPRRGDPPGAGQLRRLPRGGPQAGRELPRVPRELRQPGPHRGAEDRRVRGRGHPRRRPGLPPAARGQRGQHHRVLEGLPRVRRPLREPARGRLGRRAARGGHEDPRDVGLPGRGRRPDRPGPPRDRPGHDRHRHPDRQPGLVGAGRGRPRRVRRDDRLRHGRGDPRGPSLALREGGRVRRARLRRRRRRAAQAPRRRERAGRQELGHHRHRPRPQGPAVGPARRRRRRRDPALGAVRRGHRRPGPRPELSHGRTAAAGARDRRVRLRPRHLRQPRPRLRLDGPGPGAARRGDAHGRGGP
ncbi:hypothetical protein MICRO116_210022 [Micrococcus sp. 116]|nr:hypothetical protein MICRO116_210022 [Micrococcus sp. 116]